MSTTTRIRKHRAALLTSSAMIATMMAAGPPAAADHTDIQPTSAGIYRIPYEDGTQLNVSGDHHNHTPPNRLDMVADSAPAEVVAAASGTVRAVVDIHGDYDGNGDGRDINGNEGVALDYGGVHADDAEQACQDGEDVNGNDELDPGEDINGNGSLDGSVLNWKVVGRCSWYNNYVWLEHPNGEWTKYTHMRTGSISGSPGNLTVGDWVDAGQSLGIEADVGRASGRHLHFEDAERDDPTDITPFNDSAWVWNDDVSGGGHEPPPGMTSPGGETTGYYRGGFLVPDHGENRVPRFCDIPGNLLDDDLDPDDPDVDEPYTADECDHEPPVADAGGPYEVDEGTTFQLDGSGSSDPEDRPLTYAWGPTANLDDPSLEQPTYDAVDDAAHLMVLQVYDQVEALRSTSITNVTVNNVAPTVSADNVIILEGGTAVVSATVTDPGVEDEHEVVIDWGDGTPEEEVGLGALLAGVPHPYGDNGTFDVEITVTDDDGGVGSDTAAVEVGNVPPSADLDVDTVSFPGGDYAVVQPGEELPADASATDPGSDDLTFSWSTGDATTYFNDGEGPDPFPSPLGTYPFAASDSVVAVFGAPGSESVELSVTDDDGGSNGAAVGAVVTGTADTTEGSGWWKHQFAGTGSPQVDADTLEGYLETVDAVSGVFAEAVSAQTPAEAHAVLSPTNDARDRATAELLVAWLQFASGAVGTDTTVPLQGGAEIGFLDLMFTAEGVILDGGASAADLLQVQQHLSRVKHAG